MVARSPHFGLTPRTLGSCDGKLLEADLGLRLQGSISA